MGGPSERQRRPASSPNPSAPSVLARAVPRLRAGARRTIQTLCWGPRIAGGIAPETDPEARLRSVGEGPDGPDGAPKPFAVFFGYYDKSPWSPDGSGLLMHVQAARRDPGVRIAVVDDVGGTWRPLASSSAWSYQQGSMAQWLPGSAGSRVIFNDIEHGQLIARIVDREGREITRAPHPVQAVHPEGAWALSLNYRRLARLRPEYGYDVAVDNFDPEAPPERDGLWRVDLRAGSVELFVSLADLAARERGARVDAACSKVNHALFSPRGTRFVFMFRWFHAGGKSSRLYVVEQAGDPHPILDEDFVSHYSWMDETRLLVYGRRPGGPLGYFVLDTDSGAAVSIGEHGLDGFGDGHPSLSPDGRWIVTDTYPDRRCRQTLMLARPDGTSLRRLARLFHPPQYHGVTRCDLHPRWRPGGNAVSFDSLWSGKRRSYILDLPRATS